MDKEISLLFPPRKFQRSVEDFNAPDYVLSEVIELSLMTMLNYLTMLVI